MEKGGEWGKPRPRGSTKFDELSVISDWASLLPELVQGIADCVLSTTGGVDAYMDMRAVCPSWRSVIAKPSPLDAVADLRFRPRHWIMVDMKPDNHDDDARLFLHGPTGRLRRLRLPVLRHHILVDVSDDLLVLGDREAPHFAHVLNPFTGGCIFKFVTPAELVVIAKVSPDVDADVYTEGDDSGLHYLVESSGELLLIHYVDQTMKVFRVNVELKLLEEVKSLSRHALSSVKRAANACGKDLSVHFKQGELDGRFADAEEKSAAPAEEPAEAEEEEEEEGDEDEDWSDDNVREAHAWLDTAESPDGSTRLSATFSGAGGAARRPNAHGGMLARTLQPLSNRQQKLASHFRAGPLEEWEGRMNVGMSNSVTTAIRDNVRDSTIGKTRNTGKADRATVEQANVYHATKKDGSELAIKVYKTSVLVFKDRDRYVQGDYRFRYGYCKHNPRKMVKTWAEKETRNLLRVGEKGIRCPKPVHLKLHVLAMEFIGKNGCNAPRLKDAGLPDDKLRVAYFEIVTTMRTLYQKCKLVHGDLSEYNILYYEGHLYIIDVSQSVDLDHPLALDFLKEDCLHVNDFFEKRGVAVMTVTELFNFVVDQKIADEDVDDYLEKVQQKIMEKGDRDAEDDEIAPTVLVQTLDYVKQCEADIVNMSVAQRPSLGYEPTADKLYDLPQLGFVRAKKEPSEKQQEEAAQDTLEEPLDLQNKCSLEENKEEDESDDNESCSGSDEDSWWQESTKLGPKEKKAARKENKKKVKEEKRETRKTKIHKADKKKRKKMAKAKCKR
ncbi:hypothetical protein ACQ4PT_017201 [Festuca glaucescens]